MKKVRIFRAWFSQNAYMSYCCWLSSKNVPSGPLALFMSAVAKDLVRQTPQAAVDVWVAGASAYVTGMNTTVSVRMLRPFVVP